MEILSSSTKGLSLQDLFMVEEVKHYPDLCPCVPRPEHYIGERGKTLVEENNKTREEGQSCV